MQTVVVGVTGAAHSGKDTTADYIVSALATTRRVVKVGLADRLKLVCQSLIRLFYGADIPIGDFYDAEKKEEVRANLPDFAGRPFRLRTVMQLVGTEVMRGIVSNAIWCDVVKSAYLDPGLYDVVVINDLRMADEAGFFSALAEAGVIKSFFTVRLVRPQRHQLAAENETHESEIGVSSLRVDVELVNNSTVGALQIQIDREILSLFD